MLDIDNMKLVNDSMGHFVGDAMICEVGRRLASAGKNITVYPLGGDEFAVICARCSDSEMLATLAGQLLRQMEQPFECDGNSIMLQITIGGVLSKMDGTSADVLRQNADLALYHAKQTARGEYIHFEPGLCTGLCPLPAGCLYSQRKGHRR